METRSYNVYSFAELTDEQKQKAVENLWDINMNCDWWEFTYEDANAAGLKISAFDLDRGSYCELSFISGSEYTATAILKNHGESCDTYILAKAFLADLENETGDAGRDDLSADFRRALSEEFLSMLRNEYEYLTSEAAIIETIEANAYMFTENGDIA